MRLTKEELERIRDYTVADTAQRLLDTIDALESELATARATVKYECEQKIIAIEHALKLSNVLERIREKADIGLREDGGRWAKQTLDAIDEMAEQSLALIPTSHAAALEKIVAERVLAESEVWNNNAGVKRLDDESEWAKMRLAANRAAAGAGDQNR